MSSDFDPLDELFDEGVKSVKPSGRFLPKPKPRPIPKKSIKPPSLQPVQNVESTNNETKRPSESDPSLANKSLEHSVRDTLVDSHALQNDVILSANNGKPVGEETLMNTDVDPLDELFNEGVKSVRISGRLLPKHKPRPTTSIKPPSSQPVQNAGSTNSETKTSESNLNSGSELNSIKNTVSANNSLYKVNSSVQQAADHITVDAFSGDGNVHSDSDVAIYFNDGVLEIEEIEAGPITEGLENICDMTTQSGHRSRKFQPTPKFQVDRRKNSAVTSDFDGSRSIPCFVTVEFMSRKDLTGPAESSFPDPSCSGDQPSGSPETLEKSSDQRLRNTSTASGDCVEPQEAYIAGADNEAGISTRKMRKRVKTYALVDENEEQAHDGSIANEHPSSSPIEEGDYNDGEDEVEKETQKGKKRKRSRKASPEKEKPVRNRKKVNEAKDQATQKPRKKFSHSTRRNKRQVDKTLLETPEDDIDMKKLRIRDIILLAEHRERAVSKKGKIAEAPAVNQGAGTSFGNDNDNYNYSEGEDFASEGGQFGNDQTLNNDQTQNSSYFNYHSYMKKTPRSRWSKQDTELFYKGIQQFGSDISMIQQLFPDRTRAQVKLKYKKEERQQPMMLHEALTNRATDHSHFQRVIEQLKQLAAEENQNSFEDDSTDLAGNGEEVIPELNEEAEILEKVEEREDDGMGPDPSEAQSPAKSAYDSDDDWCHYKSEL